ncbi:MAG: hypothetical protein IIU46_05240 [Treponema sp.]|nr:hypothetical protein [Treponema sp.]
MVFNSFQFFNKVKKINVQGWTVAGVVNTTNCHYQEIVIQNEDGDYRNIHCSPFASRSTIEAIMQNNLK